MFVEDLLSLAAVVFGFSLASSWTVPGLLVVAAVNFAEGAHVLVVDSQTSFLSCLDQENAEVLLREFFCGSYSRRR